MDSDKKGRLRPSLLDSLTDRHPERQLEGPRERSVDEDELREQVRRDLTWLFNTTHLNAGIDLSAFPHAQRSVVNFGLPTLTGRMLSGISKETLARQVLEALLRFEPRLLPDTIQVAVSIGETHAGIAALIIDIAADLWAEPQPLALHLRTEVDVETGRVAIEKSSPQRAH